MYGFCDCVSKAREIFDGMVQTGKEMKVSTLNAMLDAYCIIPCIIWFQNFFFAQLRLIIYALFFVLEIKFTMVCLVIDISHL